MNSKIKSFILGFCLMCVGYTIFSFNSKEDTIFNLCNTHSTMYIPYGFQYGMSRSEVHEIVSLQFSKSRLEVFESTPNVELISLESKDHDAIWFGFNRDRLSAIWLLRKLPKESLVTLKALVDLWQVTFMRQINATIKVEHPTKIQRELEWKNSFGEVFRFIVDADGAREEYNCAAIYKIK